MAWHKLIQGHIYNVTMQKKAKSEGAKNG